MVLVEIEKRNVFSECRLDGSETTSLEDSWDGPELANSVPPGLQGNALGRHFQPEGPGKKTTKIVDGCGLKTNKTTVGGFPEGETLDMNSWAAQLKEMERVLVA